MTKYGYARISDKSQNLDAQIDELKDFGVDEIVQEVYIGIEEHKDKLEQLLEKLTAGDELIVARHDRLGKNTLQLLTLVNELNEKDVRFRILNLNGFDTKGPFAEPILAIFSAFSEMERSIWKEKQRRGIEAARKKGKHLGRRGRDWTKEGLESALQEYLKGEKTVNEISDIYNIPRSSLYYYIKKAGIR
ncbi:hypothetical protein AWH48_16635 [Domibacillus aminovorans]|uniref:Resolvase/invertase-type recombinase catalytic domain-containing protein n=1 Tax=Domibacillus aminovorans TaxID=29332 RepID=A0A177KZR5_9BACI|nr:recombinase family protein [Domibacillus aminovorans]OAH58627.1 hypothetical protein AWH48_16635 [Domibacillus aminovorans]